MRRANIGRRNLRLEVAAIVGRILERCFLRILLLFLRDHLLKSYGLQQLVRLLLLSELKDERLVDPLQRRHISLLGWVQGMSRGFEVLNILLTLDFVRAHCAERLKITFCNGVVQVGGRALRGNLLLA